MLKAAALFLAITNPYNTNTDNFGKWQVVKPAIYRCNGSGVLDNAALNYVNRKVNQAVQYAADATDYWQTPAETMRIQAGDCEDYAILKMDLLGRIFELCNTDLTIATNRLTGELHALLKVYAKKDFVVLDSLSDKILSSKDYQRTYKEIFIIGVRGWRYTEGGK